MRLITACTSPAAQGGSQCHLSKVDRKKKLLAPLIDLVARQKVEL